MRTLNLHRSRDGVVVEDPVVLAQADGSRSSIITQVVLDGLVVRYNSDGQPLEIELDESGFNITPEATAITMTGSDGQQRGIRRISEEDGVWASKIGGPAPADSLEQLALGGTYMGNEPFADLDESLWVALDGETEEFRELVYSSAAGIYLRSRGGWHKLPDEDESLDGLESIDVNGDIVEAFDVAEQGQTALTRDEVLEYEIETDEEVEETPAETEPEPVPEE